MPTARALQYLYIAHIIRLSPLNLCVHTSSPQGLTSSPLRGPTQWLVYNGTQRFRLYTTLQLRGPSPGVHQGRSRVPRLRHTPARPGRAPWQMPGARMANFCCGHYKASQQRNNSKSQARSQRQSLLPTTCGRSFDRATCET